MDESFDEHDENDQYTLWKRAQEIAEANYDNDLYDFLEYCESEKC